MDEFGFDLTSGGSDFFSELDSIYNNVTEPEISEPAGLLYSLQSSRANT